MPALDLNPALARARAWPAPKVDAVLGGLVVLLSVAEVLLGGLTAGEAATALPVVVPVAAGVVLRRRRPLVAALLALVGMGATLLAAEAATQVLTSVFLGWALVTYTAAVRLDRLPVLAIAVLSVLFVGAVSLAVDSTAAQFTTGVALFVVAPIAAGTLLRSRNVLAARLAAQTREIEDQRTSRIQESVTGERVRIAGELHDVVAHALGAMTIQAAVARRMCERDAERAVGAFQAVETTGREALTELRTLMEVLRQGPAADPGLEPQPGLDGLAALVARSGDRGLPTDLAVEGEPPPALPQGVGLTAYRVVQDALAEAAARGGAGRAHVRVTFNDDTVELHVVDDGVRVAGRRLVGLQERVRVCGGRVSTGARPAGGHLVQVTLPVTGVPA